MTMVSGRAPTPAIADDARRSVPRDEDATGDIYLAKLALVSEQQDLAGLVAQYTVETDVEADVDTSADAAAVDTVVDTSAAADVETSAAANDASGVSSADGVVESHAAGRSDGGWLARRSRVAQAIAHVQRPANVGYVALLSISVLALLLSLLNFGLITGALRVPTPGLQASGATGLSDGATYNFEQDTNGWHAKGAATSAVWNNTHTFAGQGALEVQVTGISPSQKAFVYVTLPPSARPGSTVTAHLYVPTGSPPMLATLYALDGSWAWMSGAFPSLNPGTWTAVTYALPKNLAAPIRELGVMVIGESDGTPYTGVLYLDSVNVQN